MEDINEWEAECSSNSVMESQSWCCSPLTSALCEAEAGRPKVQAQPGQVSESCFRNEFSGGKVVRHGKMTPYYSAYSNKAGWMRQNAVSQSVAPRDTNVTHGEYKLIPWGMEEKYSNFILNFN